MKRRDFISTTLNSAAGISLGASGLSPSSFRGANDKIILGLIGAGARGLDTIISTCKVNSGVEIKTVCDVKTTRLEVSPGIIEKELGYRPGSTKYMKAVFDDKDIDAVMISTPEHWHALATVWACQAGKDVYVEKPMANTIAECNIMVRAANYYSNRIVQIGQQQRSGLVFQEAIKLIKNEKIGKLRKINIWANFEYGVGQSIVPDEPVPAGVDFNMWLGPAPERSFNNTRFHGSWRMFWDYGGGLVSDWGVHLLDIGLWAKDVDAPPAKVLVYGANTYHEPRSRETFDSMSVIYPYNDFVINFDVTAGVQKGPYDMLYGLAFIGDNGTLVADRNKLTLYPEWDNEAKKPRTEEYKYTGGKESHGEHVKNFIECIRTRNKPACPPETGRAAAMHVHIPNIAARTGESMLLWDDKAGRFTNSEKANQLITPSYRQPWTLPSI